MDEGEGCDLTGVVVLQGDVGFHETEVGPVMTGGPHHGFVIAAHIRIDFPATGI